MSKKIYVALSVLIIVLIVAGSIVIHTIITKSKSHHSDDINENTGIQNKASENQQDVSREGKDIEKTGVSETGQKESSGGKTHNDDSSKNGTDTQKADNSQKDRFKDIKVKALYLTGSSAGREDILDSIINLAKTTELNAVVIDIKEAGRVNYLSNVPEVYNNKLYTDCYDPIHVINKLHENNIYVIGRIVCFRDDGLAKKRVDLAIKRTDGAIWYEGSMGAWTNPFNKEVWKYNIDIAKEAIQKGFDEIQFDYVRFPATKKNEVFYGNNLPTRVDAICDFLNYSVKELRNEENTMISADIFGIVCESKLDGEAIGQDLEKIGMSIDYICPMIYPSHYANASKGIMGNGVGQGINGILFTAPDLKPYEVVYNALVKTRSRLSELDKYKAKVRPYLQDFTAKYLSPGYFQQYGEKQVREQIQAVYDAGYEEWILWSGTNTYSVGAFNKK